MHPLLRYTLDLFDAAPLVHAPISVVRQRATPARPRKTPALPKSKPFLPLALVDSAQPAIEMIAPSGFFHPQTTREVRLGDAVVGYAFARAKRRTIGFMVGPDGLVVRAPRWTPLSEVDAALQEKASWILRKLHETRERHAKQQDARIVWCNGAVFPLLGDTITVQLDPGHHFTAQGAQLGEGTLRVALSQDASATQIRDAVHAWLMRFAKAHFTQRLDHFAPQLQVCWTRMSLSNAGTRWGSAKADGSIRLNWRLVHFSPAVVDYVVAHELSHLRVMDHSPRFWDTVRTVVPDYADLRGQLKDDVVPKW
jgi:predicted metal-dependent hydrolase